MMKNSIDKCTNFRVDEIAKHPKIWRRYKDQKARPGKIRLVKSKNHNPTWLFPPISKLFSDHSKSLYRIGLLGVASFTKGAI